MKVVALTKYASFRCLAGACPSTCCSGWNILVDEEDYKRFKELEPEWLRQDILSNIRQRGGRYFFNNQKSGRCAMLDKDGLCRIQRNASEEVLCNTCRKYPRLINLIEGIFHLSMAASCPAVSEYLVCGDVGWSITGDSGKVKNITVEEYFLAEDAWKWYQELWETAGRLCEQHPNVSLLYAYFEKMASEVLKIIVQNPQGSIPVQFFQALEEDVSDKLGGFIDSQRILWKRILNNYMNYRILSRKIEFPEEKDSDCVRQAQGELFLLRALAFCRFCEIGVLSVSDWQDLLQRVYRFCAHGRKVCSAFHNVLENFFPQDELWSYMLG